jgi:hypothetical protein
MAGFQLSINGRFWVSTEAIDDSTFTTPWTAAMPVSKTDGRIFEYACHEGNYALPGILGGARAQEKAAAETAKKGSN